MNFHKINKSFIIILVFGILIFSISLFMFCKHLDQQTLQKIEALNNQEELLRKKLVNITYRSNNLLKNTIIEKKIILDMTPKDVSISWGEPIDKDSQFGSLGVIEQWVYRDRGYYLYFQNGILIDKIKFPDN